MVSITRAGSSRPSRGQRDAGQARTDKVISLLGRRGFDADVVCARPHWHDRVAGPADRAGLKLRLAVAPRGSRAPGCHGLVNVGRMQLYLPVAEMSANVFIFLAMGGAVGFLSGMFGVGGGFLMTPLLIFAGIPAAVAVGTETAQILASSVSGALAQWRRRNVDVKMGAVLLAGGLVGSTIGVGLVGVLRRVGVFDVFVAACYVTFLGVIGTLMMIESTNTIRQTRAGRVVSGRRPGQHNWVHGLPLKMRFNRSKLYISAIPPLLLGLFVGLLAAIMGVGGGFIMVPAMIYLLRMPTNVVVGTSLFQIVFLTAATTVLHASQNFNVDVVLAMILMAGGVIGAQFGTVAGERLKGEQLRFLLAAFILAVCARFAWQLIATPSELYTLSGNA